jgi:hypothetical protein
MEAFIRGYGFSSRRGINRETGYLMMRSRDTPKRVIMLAVILILKRSM